MGLIMTDQYTPRPRGRPPIQRADEPAPGDPVAPSRRRRRANVGQAALKLSAPSREGYHRRWVNDDGPRLANAKELAYDFVHEEGIKSDTPGSRISRRVGTKANGEPLLAYLMETPDELYAEGVAEMEAYTRQIDEAIRSGRDSTGSADLAPSEAGTYGHGSIQVER